MVQLTEPASPDRCVAGIIGRKLSSLDLRYSFIRLDCGNDGEGIHAGGANIVDYLGNPGDGRDLNPLASQRVSIKTYETFAVFFPFPHASVPLHSVPACRILRSPFSLSPTSRYHTSISISSGATSAYYRLSPFKVVYESLKSKLQRMAS